MPGKTANCGLRKIGKPKKVSSELFALRRRLIDFHRARPFTSLQQQEPSAVSSDSSQRLKVYMSSDQLGQMRKSPS